MALNKDELDFIANQIQKANEKNKKVKGIAKLITLGLVLIITVFGILGSFAFMNFDMTSYALFLDKFAIILSVLIGSVGFGIAAKKVTDVIKKNAENKGD